MIIFIYGPDNYRSAKRLKDLQNKFKEKFGDVNIACVEIEKNDEADGEKIMSQIHSVPFLSEKRLVIVKNLLLNGDKKLKELIYKKLNSVPKSTIAIFYEEGEPRKNQKLFNILNKADKVEVFVDFSEAELISWIKYEAQRLKGRIDSVAAQRLFYFVGNDLFRLEQEVNKLVNYCYPRVVKVEDVEKLVNQRIEARIFDLLDMLAARRIKPAMGILDSLIKNGEKELHILSMINYGFRNLVLVKFLVQKNPKIMVGELVKSLVLHPFVARKALSAVNSFSMVELKEIYQKLLKSNIDLRSNIDNSSLTLDLLVYDICQR